jgi:hypothetical protein
MRKEAPDRLGPGERTDLASMREPEVPAVRPTPSQEETARPLLKLRDLSPLQREHVMTRARQYRLDHHPEILKLLSRTVHDYPARRKPQPPEGIRMFHPERWEAHHWEWMSGWIMREVAIRMGARPEPSPSEDDRPDASPR